MPERFTRLAGACFCAAVLAACGGATTSLSLTSSALTHSVQYPHTQGVRIAKDSCCDIAVDTALNRVYVSSGGNLRGNHTTVVDGSSFSIVATVNGFGGAYNVDYATHNVWLPGLYGADAEVYSGIADRKVTIVSLGGCPVSAWVDGKRRHAWVAAQCGSDDDPVWAVNADTYTVVAGPIGTGGVMGLTILNPATGKFYVNNSAGNLEINPITFKVNGTSFGVALGVDSTTNVLYARGNNGLNIVDGRNDKIQKAVPLSYSPGFVGVNRDLNHIYLSAGQNAIEVREGTAGTLLKTITLASGIGILSLGADRTRSRIYAVGTSGGDYYLYKVDDRY